MKRIFLLLALLTVFAIAGWCWRDAANVVGWSAAIAATQKTANSSSTAAAQSGKPESKIIVQAPVEMNKSPIGTGAGAGTGASAVESAAQTREPLSTDQARNAEMMSRRNFAKLIAETANADDAPLNTLSLMLVDFCMAHTSARAKAQADGGGPPPNSLRANPSTTGDGLRADAISSRRLENARVITESCKNFNEGSGQSYADAALT